MGARQYAAGYASAAQTSAITIQWPRGASSGGRGAITMAISYAGAVSPYTKTVQYGEGSDAASLAGAFGAHISADRSAPVWAKGYANGTIRMKSRGAAITGISFCILPDGTSSCTNTPSPAAPANPITYDVAAVIPPGVTLQGALYGYTITEADGSSGYDDRGNIVGYTDTVNGRWSAGYDALNRITSARQELTGRQLTENSLRIKTLWSDAAVEQYLCWQYDIYRLQQASAAGAFTDSNCSASTSATASVQLGFDAAGPGDNRIRSVASTVTSGPRPQITAGSYDAAGNLKTDNIFDYQYDGDGRLCAVRKIRLPWSNGMVEGQIHRLKLLKRQMYGRAGFHLLRERVLHAA